MSQYTGSAPLPAPVPGNSTRLDLDQLLEPDEAPTPKRRRKRTGRAHKTNGRKDYVMPLAEHLAEFQKRFVLALAGIVIASVVGWMFSDAVFQTLQHPFAVAAGQQDGLMSITFTGVVSAFNVRLQLAIFLGFLMSCPWWSYQLWAFINPGLKRKERWSAIVFIAVSVPLFLTGAAIAWTFLPQAIVILTGFAPAGTATLISADVYFSFIMHMTVAFGLAFLLPVVMFALTMLGLVTSKGWLAHWRIAVVIAFVFAAVATPTGDIGTMSALALPICLLYFVTIAACWGYERVQVLRILCETGAEPRWLQRIRNVQRSLARPFRRRSRADDVSTTCQEG